MKIYLVILACLLFSIESFSQVFIPDFKSDTGKIEAPFLKYVKNYDLILAYRAYSNWSYETEYHLLVLQGSHWKKLIYKKTYYNDPKELTIYPISEKPTTDSLAYSLYNKLVANNLFTIKDDTEIPACDETKEIVNGKEQKVKYFISDGGEYSLWMITPVKSRHLYYYAPDYFAKYCAPDEKNRAYALKIAELFYKEW